MIFREINRNNRRTLKAICMLLCLCIIPGFLFSGCGTSQSDNKITIDSKPDCNTRAEAEDRTPLPETKAPTEEPIPTPTEEPTPSSAPTPTPTPTEKPTLKPTEKPTPKSTRELSKETKAPEVPTREDTEGKVTYVVNTNTKKFHKPSCSSVKDIKDSNRWDFTGAREELLEKGYVPCKKCNP